MPRIYTTEERTPIDGQLRPGELLTKEGAWSCAGIGREQLKKAKASGIVKPIVTDRRVYFRSSELIAWIESHVHKAD